MTLTAKSCDQSSRSKIDYPHLRMNYEEWTKAGPAAWIDLVQTEANNDKDVSIKYNSSIYPLTPVQLLSRMTED